MAGDNDSTKENGTLQAQIGWWVQKRYVDIHKPFRGVCRRKSLVDNSLRRCSHSNRWYPYVMIGA